MSRHENWLLPASLSLGDSSRRWAEGVPGAEGGFVDHQRVARCPAAPLPADTQHHLRREELHHHLPPAHRNATDLRQEMRCEKFTENRTADVVSRTVHSLVSHLSCACGVWVCLCACVCAHLYASQMLLFWSCFLSIIVNLSILLLFQCLFCSGIICVCVCVNLFLLHLCTVLQIIELQNIGILYIFTWLVDVVHVDICFVYIFISIGDQWLLLCRQSHFLIKFLTESFLMIVYDILVKITFVKK